MPSQPSVSVIIPAYNSSKFIVACLESVFAQSISPLEVIVCDDGSTDGTDLLVAQRFPKVLILKQPNSGPSSARNLGAQHAKGDYLAFIDSDDEWMPNKLELQLQHISPTDGFAYTNRINIGSLDNISTVQSDAVNLLEGQVFDSLLADGNCITTSSVLMPRDWFNELGGFCLDPEVQGVEDWDLWLRSAFQRPISLVKVPLVKYRVHEASLSKNILKMFRAQERVIERQTTVHGIVKHDRRIRNARACSAATWGWFAANSRLYYLSCKLYIRAILLNPTNAFCYKGLLKSLLRKS